MKKKHLEDSAKMEKKHLEDLAKMEKKARDLQMENQMLRNDNKNLKFENMQIQDKNFYLTGQNEDLKTKLRSYHVFRNNQLKFNGSLERGLTTIEGELKGIRDKMDKMVDGEKRLKDEVDELKPGMINFP